MSGRARKIYKSLELGLDRTASEPEGEQSLRVARKIAGSLEPKRTLEEIITESGEYHQHESHHHHVPEYEPPHHHEAPPKEPKAKPPRRKASASGAQTRWPKTFPFKCEYLKKEFTKATAWDDACTRLKSDNVVEVRYEDKKRWVFVRTGSEDRLKEIQSHYKKNDARMVGEDRDIELHYYHN